MYLQTLFYILQWWFVLFILGLLFLPLTARFFQSFKDSGYIFAKVIGCIFITYTAFVLGTIHLLPFTTLSLWGILLGFSLLNIFILKKNVFLVMKSSWKITVIEELLFFTALLVWSFIRGFQPDIHGLEKYMDYGFVNSILRSTYFPPKDMWMTPLSINYYYFGHLITAVLTKLSFIPSAITFNLMIATLFALTLSTSFSLGGNLFVLLKKLQGVTKINMTRFILSGLLVASLVTLAGNLHTLYTFFTPYENENPVPPWTLTFAPQTFPNQYWYPNATRFIYHTIHEFPLYSFVVSDLHGHVLDIPLVFLSLAILLVFFVKTDTQFNPIFYSVCMGSLCAIMYMTNAWDGLIYIVVSSALLIYKLSQKNLLSLFDTALSLKFLRTVCVLIVCFVVVSLPFSLFFKPIASQIGLNCAPNFLIHIGHIGPLVFEQDYCQHSPFWQLAILYGFFFFWGISFSSLLLFLKKKRLPILPTDIFIGFLFLLGALLIVVPEFVYLKDIYTTYFRANTMFKLVYQSFLLLSVASGYTIYRILQIKNPHLPLWRRIISFVYPILGLLLVSLVLIYPYFAVSSYYNNLKSFSGLNGIAYLNQLYPNDAKAILWLNTHIAGQPILLEAQGDSYTDFERISSNTGLPTVFGWTVHEWLWRGTYDVAPPRIADVQSLYTSGDITQTKQLLKKYTISYVYVGDLERKQYPTLSEGKFEKLGTVVFQSGNTRIYKIY